MSATDLYAQQPYNKDAWGHKTYDEFIEQFYFTSALGSGETAIIDHITELTKNNKGESGAWMHLVCDVHGGGVLPGTQVPPAVGIAVAVLVMLVGAGVATVPVTMKTTEVPGGIVGTVSLIGPVPVVFAHTAPVAAMHVQALETMPAGSGSLTRVPSAFAVP